MGTLGICATLPGGAGGDTPINLGVMWLKLLEMDGVDPYAHLWQMLIVGISLRFVSFVAMVIRCGRRTIGAVDWRVEFRLRCVPLA
jgi:hypothetical protein